VPEEGEWDYLETRLKHPLNPLVQAEKAKEAEEYKAGKKYRNEEKWIYDYPEIGDAETPVPSHSNNKPYFVDPPNDLYGKKLITPVSRNETFGGYLSKKQRKNKSKKNKFIKYKSHNNKSRNNKSRKTKKH